MSAQTSGSAAQARKRLSVVVPVYFNEGSLPGLHEALRDVEGTLASRGIVRQNFYGSHNARRNSAGRRSHFADLDQHCLLRAERRRLPHHDRLQIQKWGFGNGRL